MSDQYDEIEVEILDDGSVKFVTDEISGPNHGSAEQLLSDLSKAMGGSVRRTKIGNKPVKQKQKLRA